LGNAIHFGNSRLGKLLQIEAWNLAPKNEPAVCEFAPNSLRRQMGLMENPLPGCVSRPSRETNIRIGINFHKTSPSPNRPNAVFSLAIKATA
jgi:hypothetical protein